MKNIIKKIGIILLQMGVIFYPILYLFDKKENSELTRRALLNNKNILLFILFNVAYFLVLINFRNNLIHVSFILLGFISLWIYIHGVIDSLSYLKTNKKSL